MKTFYVRLTFVSLFVMLFIASCNLLDSSKTKVNVKPHQHQPGDRYCIYEITEVEGEGALKVGDQICVLCGYDQCEGERTIIPAEGIEYSVENINVVMVCQTCPDAIPDGNIYADSK